MFFSTQFTISCVVLLLLKMESLYAISPNAIQQPQEAAWLEFLRAIMAAAKDVERTDIVNVEFETDICKPLLSHLGRFQQLDAQYFVAVLTHKNI